MFYEWRNKSLVSVGKNAIALVWTYRHAVPLLKYPYYANTRVNQITLYRIHLRSIQEGNRIWLNYELSYKFYRSIVRIFFLLFLSLNTTVL